MFVKLFTQILDSSISNNRSLRHFFIDLLLCADSRGYVIMTKSAIARRIGSDMSEVEWGISELLKPDAESKSRDCGGARIEAMDGLGYGWKIINYDHYRTMKDADQLRETARERVRKFRERKRAVTPVTLGNANVTLGNANTEAEAEADTEKKIVSDKPKLNSVRTPDGTVSSHTLFIKLWTESYATELGTVYAFQSGKDGKAVKTLLEQTKKTPEELVEIAKCAWRKTDGFWSKMAASITGFNSKFNEISAEVRKSKPQTESKYANAFLHQN